MLILFFDSVGVIHYEYVPEGRTVNAVFYVQVLDHLCKHIAYVRLEMLRDQKFFLLYDNAHPHAAAIVQQFLAKKRSGTVKSPSIFARFKPPNPTILLSQN